jgi:hypothetical protein
MRPGKGAVAPHLWVRPKIYQEPAMGNNRDTLVPKRFEPEIIADDPVFVPVNPAPSKGEQRQIHERPTPPPLPKGKLVRDPSPTPPVKVREKDDDKRSE